MNPEFWNVIIHWDMAGITFTGSVLDTDDKSAIQRVLKHVEGPAMIYLMDECETVGGENKTPQEGENIYSLLLSVEHVKDKLNISDEDKIYMTGNIIVKAKSVFEAEKKVDSLFKPSVKVLKLDWRVIQSDGTWWMYGGDRHD